MKVQVTPAAIADLKHVFREGVEHFGYFQADKYLDELEKMFHRLRDFPERYPTRHTSTRSFRACPVGAHIILYEVKDDTISILRVRHSREDWERDP